ncbi:MAG: hypothetical protein ACXV5L_03745 [Thermoanaerobaculia bacterium]
MRKTLLAAILALAALPAAAQVSEFGILLGGSKRLISHSDVAQGIGVADNFKFSNSVKEIYYSILLDEDSRFKIKVGQIIAPGAFRVDNARVDVDRAKVEHADALVDYHFSEPFGSTGLFAGIGLYRQSASGQQEETNYGFSGGVNGDFPLSRRYGVVVEGTYHWVNYHYRPRYLTLTGGLRISF